jgi:hypothetical protein
MIDYSEYVDLREQLKEDFDARYKQIDDCEKTVEKEEKKIDALTIEFAKSNTKLNIMIAILSAIGAAILPICVKILFGG